MKKYKLLNVLAAAVAIPLVFAACSALQDSLHDEMAAQQKEDTGKPYVTSTTLYYDGSEATDLTGSTSTPYYYRVDFTKEIAAGDSGVSCLGTLKYTTTEDDTISISKTLGGTIGPDKKSYLIDISPAFACLDGNKGFSKDNTATIALKLTGIVAASGSQRGRPVEKFEKEISLAPLYADSLITSGVAFSTFADTTGKTFTIPLNGKVELSPSATIMPMDTFAAGELSMALSEDQKDIVVTVANNHYGESGTANVAVYGIRPINAEAYISKVIKVNLDSSLIVIDGKVDENWSEGVSADDAVGDGSADGWAQDSMDIKKLYVANDVSNLYVGIAGALGGVSWNSNIQLWIDVVGKDFDSSDPSNIGTIGYYLPATTTYENGEPDIFFLNIPNQDGDGGMYTLSGRITNAWGWYTNDASETIVAQWGATTAPMDTTNMNASKYCWKDAPDYVEYSFDLSKLGLSVGTKIRVVAVLMAHWDGGVFAADTCPDMDLDATHSAITVDFDSGLEYTIK